MWVDVEERTWEVSFEPTQHNLGVLAYDAPDSNNFSFLQVKIVAPHRHAVHQHLRIRVDDYLVLEIVHPVNFYIFHRLLFLLFWLHQSL